MAFHEIKKGEFGAPAISNRVAISSYGKSVRIGLTDDIYKKIGRPAFGKVLIGSGEHSGFLAILPRNMPGSATYKFSVVNKSTISLSISCNKVGMVKGARPTTPTPFEFTDDGLIVDIRPARKPKPVPGLEQFEAPRVAAE